MKLTEGNKISISNITESTATWFSRHSLDVTVILICCLSFVFSIVESTVNQDSHHWGIMFAPAVALKNGLVPHRDVMIFYGALTTWIQSFGLSMFGETFKSLGITTGLFYSLSFWLSYRVFLTFLSKPFAFLGTLLIFLIHGYIIYPWCNYYFYTFELLSILYFVKSRSRKDYLISGVFLGLSLLTRYTAVQAALPQFLVFTAIISILDVGKVRSGLSHLLAFTMGLVFPISLFITYLMINHGLDELVFDTKLTFVAATGGKKESYQYLIDLLQNISTFSTLFVRDSRSFCFTLIFFTSAATLVGTLYQAMVKKKTISKQRRTLLFVSLTTLFSYANSLHIYEIFRLANGAALGMGVILFWVETLVNRCQKRAGLMLLIPIFAVCFFWGNSLILTRNSSVYSPWDINTITGQGSTAHKEISVLRGKILSRPYVDYYSQIYEKISLIDPAFPIINYTLDTTAALIDYPRTILQKVPGYFPNIQAAMPDNTRQIDQAIQSKKAIVISDKNMALPGYRVTLEAPSDYSWTGRLYINVPDGT
jgi:Dolichyl-phosphate-mannose-protein mannosyltransferase